MTPDIKWVCHNSFGNLIVDEEHTPQAHESGLVEEEIELQQPESKNIREKFF
jgi:hypothetical protein